MAAVPTRAATSRAPAITRPSRAGPAGHRPARALSGIWLNGTANGWMLGGGAGGGGTATAATTAGAGGFGAFGCGGGGGGSSSSSTGGAGGNGGPGFVGMWCF